MLNIMQLMYVLLKCVNVDRQISSLEHWPSMIITTYALFHIGIDLNEVAGN